MAYGDVHGKPGEIHQEWFFDCAAPPAACPAPPAAEPAPPAAGPAPPAAEPAPPAAEPAPPAGVPVGLLRHAAQRLVDAA